MENVARKNFRHFTKINLVGEVAVRKDRAIKIKLSARDFRGKILASCSK